MRIIVRTIITILISQTVISVSAQVNNREADKLYNRGLKAFKNEEWKLAEDLFSQSQSIKPADYNLYYLALIRKKNNDLCGYCDYALTGWWAGGILSKLPVSECEKKDSIYYPSVNPSLFYGLITTFMPCTGETNKYYYIQDKDKKTLRAFYIIPTDSISDTIYRTKFPDEEKLRPRLVYLKTETQPEFMGGEKGLYSTLHQNLHYPDEAKEKGIQGRVLIRFVITEDGHITDVRALNGVLRCFADEGAKLVMSTNGQWFPGEVNNIPVKTQMNLPVNFSLP